MAYVQQQQQQRTNNNTQAKISNAEITLKSLQKQVDADIQQEAKWTAEIEQLGRTGRMSEAMNKTRQLGLYRTNRQQKERQILSLNNDIQKIKLGMSALQGVRDQKQLVEVKKSLVNALAKEGVEDLGLDSRVYDEDLDQAVRLTGPSEGLLEQQQMSDEALFKEIMASSSLNINNNAPVDTTITTTTTIVQQQQPQQVRQTKRQPTARAAAKAAGK
jgi:hypothetical protein